MARYVSTFQTLLADPAAGTLLFMHAPTAIVPSADIAAALLPVVGAGQPQRLLGCWPGDAAVHDARLAFQAAGVPCYDMPEQAVGAFAIRPCPEERVETFPWRGRALTLRPIRPDDGARHLEFLGRLEPIDIRMRVFYSRKSVEREMAFIATAPGPDGGEETLGVAWPRPTPTTSAPSSASSCART